MSITARLAFAAALTATASLALAAPPTFASSNEGSHSVVATFSCTASTPLGTSTYSGSATFAGTTPTTVAVGATVVMARFQASVSIPGSLLDQAYGYGVRSITATVTAFAINATDASPATINAAAKPVKVGHTRLQASGNPPLNVAVPRKPAKVGSWVAGPKGTMVFSPGSATLAFKSNLGSLDVQCSPTSPAATLSTTTVS